MATTEWVQKSGQSSETDTDNIEAFAEQAETAEANAAASETAAAASATSAVSSATSASTSATSASTSASGASTSASAASASETAAATSESNSAASASAASTSASNAATSESNAASSASAASASETNAANSASAAASSYDQFDNRYLGAKATAPTVDNDGDPLITGALYFDTTSDAMQVYTGSAWVTGYANVANYLALSGGTMTGDLSFGDGDKAIFGAGSDLQIYHDGSNSHIREAGAGKLYIRAYDGINLETTAGEAYFTGVADGTATIYYNNSPKLATTSTGIDVTGTVTADGLTVDGDVTFGSGSEELFLFTGGASNSQIKVRDNNALEIKTGTEDSEVNRLRVSNNGDISFYEDTGTTPKFFWDASAESLSIGDAATQAPLSVETNSSGFAISIEESAGAETWQIGVDVDGDLNFHNSTLPTPQFTVSDSGNVGIGTGSPSSSLSVRSSGTTAETIAEFGNSNIEGGLSIETNGNLEWGFNTLNSRSMTFSTNQTEAMRIDASSAVHVGGTSESGTGQVTLNPSGYVKARKNSVTGIFDRITSDGDIVQFRKDGSTVGSIGNDGSMVQLSSASTGGVFVADNGTNIFGFVNGENALRPAGNNTIDLGKTDRRFKDLYLSGKITNNGTGGIQIDTSGNLLVGTASGSDPLTVSGVTLSDALQEGYASLSGTTPSIDADTAGSFALTTSGNTTFTFASVTSGRSVGFALKLTAGGSHTITWPSSVDWAGGAAPDAPASGETDVLVFYTVDGGTTWYGALSIDAAA